MTAEKKPPKPKKSLTIGAVLGTLAAIAVLCVSGMAFLTNTKTGHRILDMLDGVSYEQPPSKPGPNEIKFYGRRYSGEYSGETDKDGTADGTGHFSGSDGSRTLEIDGTFAEGIPVGECRSILIFNNGDREEYTGGFEDGEYKGVGTSTYFFIAKNDKNKEKKVLQGEWLDGENLSEGGTDTTYYHDGRVRVYKGSWADGTWSGAGVLTMNFPDDNPRSKSVTEGEWVNGSLVGTIRTVDEYRDGDTRVYEGENSDGNWNGNGVLTISHTDGTKSVLEGTWKDGELVKGTDTDYKKDGSVKKTEEVDRTSESE
ncbi:MAG: hypothetical protein K6B74_07825 [Ruminococcus sp.]|nr:hypothetical protein [Ruminococcus sp.]